MEVVNKIATLRYDWPIATEDVLCMSIGADQEFVYSTVVDFIKWYNSKSHG